MDFAFLGDYYSFFLSGLKVTLMLSVLTVLLGSLLGMFLALMRLSGVKILKFLAVSYIEFIRGTPLMVQLFIIYFGLPKVGIDFGEFTAGVLALSINSAAYVAEIFRAGIQGVDKGQMEAARSLGMPPPMAMRHIILPQAVRNILPALGNEFIVVIKESSVAMIIGIQELTFKADTVRSTTFQAFEPLIVAALLYFIMTFTLSKVLGVAERRMRAGD